MSAFSIYVIIVTAALVALALLADHSYRNGRHDEDQRRHRH